jgi:hypothetical protein
MPQARCTEEPEEQAESFTSRPLAAVRCAPDKVRRLAPDGKGTDLLVRE